MFNIVELSEEKSPIQTKITSYSKQDKTSYLSRGSPVMTIREVFSFVNGDLLVLISRVGHLSDLLLAAITLGLTGLRKQHTKRVSASIREGANRVIWCALIYRGISSKINVSVIQ